MKKKAQKGDLRNFLDPFWGFTLKTVLGIHDPRISLLFGTKNHEMWGPSVFTTLSITNSKIGKAFALIRPHAVKQFSFGPRMCVRKRFAVMELLVVKCKKWCIILIWNGSMRTLWQFRKYLSMYLTNLWISNSMIWSENVNKDWLMK